MLEKRSKSVLIFFIDSVVILSLLLATPLLAQAQEDPPVTRKQFTVQWRIDNREVDVQHYQVYLLVKKIGGEELQPQPYGEKILITGTEYDGKTTASADVQVSIPAGEDTAVWASVVAIDTSGNISHLAKPWVGYRFMNEAPAEPQGLKGGPATDVVQ
jgi:hypothetical protein